MKQSTNETLDPRVKRKQWTIWQSVLTYLIMLLISGIHVGLVVLMVRTKASDTLAVVIIMIFWAAMAALFTLITTKQIKRAYDKPMHTLAEATRAVAGGDFSIYLKPRHTTEKLDYIDVMYLDFNKMVEELGSIETMKTDFFSNVSHEMKAPLSVILSSLELIESGRLSPDEYDKQLQSAIAATQRMSDMIGNLLKLNKLEKQTIVPTMENYDLCDELCQCALTFEHIWEQKELDFEADMEDSCYISADPDLMCMVWNNLLSNAVKFTAPGGQIVLTQKTEKDRVIISIKDTGCGMSEETQKHIFDKFYQGDTSHATEGNGLGLALAQRIIQLMNGTITVESSPGQGSTFIVSLPKGSMVK